MKHIKLALFLQKFLHTSDALIISELLNTAHDADLADALVVFNHTDVVRILLTIPLTRRVSIFEHFNHHMQTAVAMAMQPDALAKLIAAMAHDERADLYNQLPEALKRQIKPNIAADEVKDITHLSSYPEGTAGANMTSDFLYIRADITATEAIDLTRRYASKKETIYYIYVIDADKKLLGVLSLRDLLLTDEQNRIQDIMRTNVISSHANDKQASVVQKIARYDLLSLPIIDNQARLIGIITADDALDLQAAQSTQTLYKTGGIEAARFEIPTSMLTNIKHASIWTLYRMRVVWLVILVFGNVFSGAGIAHFEDMISSYVVLVFFLPLLIDSGGNAGSQAATLMVRGLATGEVVLKDWGKMVTKEVLVAAALGFSMALAVALVGFVRGGPEIALVVASSMVLIVIVGSVIGLCLPFALSKLNFDPATASAPLITSIADAVGVLIYFSIASQVLSFN
ncbi:MAG: magnesium transporter [Neisseriaceae bacterium]|nr:magnesium transporter [Neisseriaceae bacterium]